MARRRRRPHGAAPWPIQGKILADGFIFTKCADIGHWLQLLRNLDNIDTLIAETLVHAIVELHKSGKEKDKQVTTTLALITAIKFRERTRN